MTPGDKFRSIQDVYKSGISTSKKKPQKQKFKTMSALYSEEVAAEPEVAIHAQEPGDVSPEFIGKVPQSAYDKVKRAVLKNAKGGANEYARAMVYNANLEGLGRETDLAEALQSYVGDYGNLKKFMDAKAANDLNVLEKTIATGSPFDMAAVVERQQAKAKFLQPKTEKSFVHALARLDGQIGRVGVGPGELMCTIISNAVKGKVGDLQFPSLGDVEFKATAGRLGSENYIADYSLKNLEKILLSRGAKYADFGHQYFQNGDGRVGGLAAKIDKIKTGLQNTNLQQNVGAEMMQYYVTLIDKIYTAIDSQEYIDEQDIENFKAILEYGDKLGKQLYQFISKFIGDHSEKETARYFTLLDYNHFRKLVDQNAYKISTTLGYAAVFLRPQEQVPLTYEEYTAALIEMRSQTIGTDEQASLISGIRQQIKENDVARLLKGDAEFLGVIGAAIQITCYAKKGNEQHFNWIVFSDIGTAKAPASMKTVGINCEGDSLGNIFVKVYRSMSKHKWKIPLSIDAANKGFQVTLL